jgi:lipoic acid synthetase
MSAMHSTNSIAAAHSAAPTAPEMARATAAVSVADPHAVPEPDPVPDPHPAAVAAADASAVAEAAVPADVDVDGDRHGNAAVDVDVDVDVTMARDVNHEADADRATPTEAGPDAAAEAPAAEPAPSPARRASRWRSQPPGERLPAWLRRPIGDTSALETVQGVIKGARLHTICEEGRCPNRAECYAAGTATFLLGGPICTRSCAFCQVDKGRAPLPLDPGEPERVAEAVGVLGLRYVVLTAVARDDQEDHGAGLFTATMAAIRRRDPAVAIEVLTPDFWGGQRQEAAAVAAQRRRLATVLAARPVCFNHNLETVERLQDSVRRGATYRRSLGLLAAARDLDPAIPTKSGLMLGLGETEEEVVAAMQDLRAVDCQRLTLGQYLRPSLDHLPVARYWEPEAFARLGAIARSLGFSQVRSGPLVRSSYHAHAES